MAVVDIFNGSVDDDSMLGGFTIIGDKTTTSKPVATDRLPSWIANATIFPSDVNVRYKVNDFPEIVDFIRQRLHSLGHDTFFPVQASVIPYLLQSYSCDRHSPPFRPSDICISAPTGSGKTLAYCVPIVQLLLHRVDIFVRALVILPVRDLACQVYRVFRELTQETDLNVVLLCGLKSLSKEQMDLIDRSTNIPVSKADIVVATPGRFVDHVHNTPGFSIERLRILVIDEADRVIAEERQDWYRLLEHCIYFPGLHPVDPDSHYTLIKSRTPLRLVPNLTIMHQCDYAKEITLQKILVSATLTHDPRPLKSFNLYFPRLFSSDNASAHISPPVEITGTTLSTDSGTKKRPVHTTVDTTTDDAGTTLSGAVFSTPTGLTEFIVCVPINVRAMFLLHLLRHRQFNRILCFTNARLTAERLFILLKNFTWLTASRLSAQMPASKRQRILNAFSRGETNILVCTDSMARGMDIKEVECVVSYEMPLNMKTYVHRIGRTARAGHPGVAFTLLSRNQFFHFKKALRAVGKTKVKEYSFHASKMKDFKADYKLALQNLEKTVKVSSQVPTGRNASVLQVCRTQLIVKPEN